MWNRNRPQLDNNGLLEIFWKSSPAEICTNPTYEGLYQAISDGKSR